MFDLGYVIDSVGVFSVQEKEMVEGCFQEFIENFIVDLFVVFVDSFMLLSDCVEWVDIVVEDNGFGFDQYFFVIVVEQCSYYILVVEGGLFLGSKLDDVEQQIQLFFVQEDWEGVIVFVVDEIQGDGGVGVFCVFFIVFVVIVVFVVIGLVVVFVCWSWC